jgi:poly(beta-D-mannuronate) lyase
MARRQVGATIAIAGSLLLAGAAAAMSGGVAPPLRPETVRAVLGKPDDPAFVCPAALAPVVDMSGFGTPYDLKDPSQSKVDPRRAALGAARYDVLIRFAGQIGALADRYLASNPPDEAVARCLVDRLRAWAVVDALLANLDDNDELGRHQAVMMQAWNLAAYASALVKLGDGDASDPARADILAWLRRLADSVEREFTGDNQWTRTGNNHLYWAAFGVGVAGAVLDEPARLDFAMAALARGLGDVAADGSLPKEVARGARAMMYQHFAALPLAGLVALADANGRRLTPAEEAALERLASFNAGEACDPALASRLAGAAQPKTADRTNLAWVDVDLPHLATTAPARAARLDALVAGLRPLAHAYFGGNVTAAYDPQALAAGRGRAGATGAAAPPC